MKFNLDKKDSVSRQIVTAIALSAVSNTAQEILNIIKTYNTAIIDIGEYDNAYESLNKIIYHLDPAKYMRYRKATKNKEYYELTAGTTYIIKMGKYNYAKIESYCSKTEKSMKSELRIMMKFYGENKFKLRQMIFMEAMKSLQTNTISVRYLNHYFKCDVIPHTFDNIIMDESVKNRIIDGLMNWKESKEWYAQHQLVHKIGIMLYGKPGTGKSTVVRAISAMFGNADILTIDSGDIIDCVRDIIDKRRRSYGTLIVLIEDIDMIFKSRESEDQSNCNSDNGRPTATTRNNTDDDNNQNTLFQLLDGIYSTDNTIYIATTNYRDRIDPALIRYGRFDIQEEFEYFDKDDALKFVQLLGYDEALLLDMNITYPIQPAYLQSKVMEYRALNMKKNN